MTNAGGQYVLVDGKRIPKAEYEKSQKQQKPKSEQKGDK